MTIKKRFKHNFSLNGAAFAAGDSLPDYLTPAQVDALESRGVVETPKPKPTKLQDKSNTKDSK